VFGVCPVCNGEDPVTAYESYRDQELVCEVHGQFAMSPFMGCPRCYEGFVTSFKPRITYSRWVRPGLESGDAPEKR